MKGCGEGGGAGGDGKGGTSGGRLICIGAQVTGCAQRANLVSVGSIDGVPGT